MVVIYTDDSGNTGPELLDAVQPFGVTALVVVDPPQHVELDRGIASLLAKLPQQPVELKFKRLAKRKSGSGFIAGVMHLLKDLHVGVFFSLTEKRYLAASLVVETFLDPLCTPTAPPRFMRQDQRKMAANLVYAVSSDDTLSAFMTAFAERNAERMTEVATRIVSLLRFHPSRDATALAEALCESLHSPSVIPPNAGGPAMLNRPTAHTFTFLSILSVIDRRLAAQQQQAKLVSDADLQFGPVLDFAFELGREESLFPSPYSEHISPLTQIGSRTAGDSAQILGLQLADICAGLISAVALGPLGDRPPGLTEAWAALQVALLSCEPSGFWEVSERAIREALPRFGKLAPLLEAGSYQW